MITAHIYEHKDSLDTAETTLTHQNTCARAEVEIKRFLVPRYTLKRYELKMENEGSLPVDEIVVNHPRVAAKALWSELDGFTDEHVVLILLTQRNTMVGISPVSIGSLNRAMFDVGSVMTRVLQAGVPAFILAHNHPSGNPLPSQEDLAVFKRMKEAADLLDRKLVDCVIVAGPERYYSWMESNPYGVKKTSV